MSITLAYTGTNANFQDACRRANSILKSEDFFNMIAARNRPYPESEPRDLQPERIAEFFRNSNLALTLKHYSRPSSVGGAFDPDYPTTLWVNVNTTRRGCVYAAVLVHECVHALSFHTPNANFSHDGDDPSENQDTAPYAIQRATRETFCDVSLKEVGLITVELKVKKGDIVAESTYQQG
jgi:hypothetical protein